MTPRYRFELRRIERDVTGYLYPKWDEAVHVTVMAATQDEAVDKATALSPKLKFGWRWAFVVDRVTEVIEPVSEGGAA